MNAADAPDAARARLRILYPAGCVALFAGLWLGYRSFFLDDAFITFRYARNLADGFGPVFNPGEAVEGYTTFLWMLVCSVPFAMLEDAGALVAIKALGLALGAAIVWRAFTFPGPDGRAGRRYAVVLLAANPVFVVNCGDGLETPLYALFLLELVRAALAARTPRNGAIAGALLAALVLTRPEAAPLVVAIPLALWAAGARPGAGWLGGFAVASVVPVAAHVSWRLAYYGALVPNTYYAKATGSLAVRIDSGLADLAGFAVGKGAVLPVEAWLALALAAFGTVAALRAGGVAARAWHVVVWLGVASRVAFDVWSGSEWMGVFRFLAPALPLVVVLADEGRRRLATSRPRAVAVGCALALAALVGVEGHAQRVAQSAGYRQGLDRAHRALGRWLAERYPPGTTVAIGDAGAVPFFSRLPIIDLWGLVEPTVARLPGEYGHRPGTADYALGREPGVIVLWTPVPIAERPPGLEVGGPSSFDSEILEDPRFRRRYQFVREFTFFERRDGALGYYLAVFERT